MHRSHALTRMRVALARPSAAVLELRIQCWLRRVARAIERRDTPGLPPERGTAPSETGPL